MNRTLSLNSYLLFLCLAALTSCDPMKTIQIANQTGTDVSVIITQDSTNLLSLGDRQIIRLDLKGIGDKSTMTYIGGFGKYSKQDLESFNSMIKEIQIKFQPDTCTIKGDDLLSFLPKRRRGLFNNLIKVRIKNCPQQE